MGGVLPDQLHVIGCHSPIHARPKAEGDKEFLILDRTYEKGGGIFGQVQFKVVIQFEGKIKSVIFGHSSVHLMDQAKVVSDRKRLRQIILRNGLAILRCQQANRFNRMLLQIHFCVRLGRRTVSSVFNRAELRRQFRWRRFNKSKRVWSDFRKYFSFARVPSQ